MCCRLTALLFGIHAADKQIVGIPMGTNCAPLVADLFFILLFYFTTSLSDDNQADIIEAFNSTNRY